MDKKQNKQTTTTQIHNRQGGLCGCREAISLDKSTRKRRYLYMFLRKIRSPTLFTTDKVVIVDEKPLWTSRRQREGKCTWTETTTTKYQTLFTTDKVIFVDVEQSS